jgi:hypothetical protein
LVDPTGVAPAAPTSRFERTAPKTPAALPREIYLRELFVQAEEDVCTEIVTEPQESFQVEDLDLPR